ncbi:EEIG1/EHBP1 N-terminal domain-containing protein [Tanacetum coccineum]
MTVSHRSYEGSTRSRSSISEFGDDNFAVGKWDNTEIISRDGLMSLQTWVFFPSIDQRSERASGESACTSLVATIATWLQNNHNQMPLKSELDTLVREGSLEWRDLCENEVYRKRFPDKHFDLETVLEAKTRNRVPESRLLDSSNLTMAFSTFLMTYERSFIEAWLGEGNHTCPKTKENLTSTKCTPNVLLRGLIADWCKTNGMDPPKQATTRAAQRSMIKSLLTKLKAGSPNVQQIAATEIRRLAKINDDYRVEIANACWGHSSPCIPSNHTRPLHTIDEHKERFEIVRAIPPLVRLLSEESGMKDEALALLDILSSHPEAKVAIGEAEAVHVLVEFIRSGSPSNKENAAAVLVNLCSGDKEYLIEAQGFGVRDILGDLQQNGTNRGKKKAGQLLKTMTY